MVTVMVHEDGAIRQADRIDPAWLAPDSPVTLWVDIASPTAEDFALLADPFQFHDLAIDDARSTRQFPKVEAYPGFLYVILHGIDVEKGRHEIATRDVDFFVTRNAIVTVHDGRSTSIGGLLTICGRNAWVMGEGPVGILHRVIDQMVDHYRPPMEELEQRLERLEEDAFDGHDHMARRVLAVKRELASVRRILVLQRDVIGRLARREFPVVSPEMSYRFRDVYDHVVRLSEEASIHQDRVTGIFEVNLSSVSNRLNAVMKVLTVMSTIFLPLTVLTSLWGMNVGLPHLPGGEAAQFWWVVAIMAALAGVMLAVFRSRKWI